MGDPLYGNARPRRFPLGRVPHRYYELNLT